MRKAAVLLAGILVLVVLVGCSVNQEFVESMERPAKMLLPDLKKYYQSDPKLDDDQKKRRIRLLEEWIKNIESAKTGMLEPDSGQSLQ